MNRHWALLIIVFVFLSSASLNGGAAAKNSMRVLSLCQLVDNWKDYHQQKVRVRAIFAVNPEMDWLHDPACRNGEALMDVEFRKNSKGAFKKLDQLISKRKRAWAVFEGVFYGPEPFKNVDPKLPDSIRVPLEKSHKRYGHMDSFDAMIEVTRVVEASEVDADVPW
jgi:hypothetical protein